MGGKFEKQYHCTICQASVLLGSLCIQIFILVIKYFVKIDKKNFISTLKWQTKLCFEGSR